MASVEQLTALIEFMECHKEVALGHLNRSKEGRSQTKRLWTECAQILNSLSANCVHKTADQRRVYFNEYKSKLLKKIKLEKAEIGATGGGPSRRTPLTPLQERLYTILGRDIGEPLPGIRHNPLSQYEHVSEVEVVDNAVTFSPPSPEHEEQEELVVIEIAADDFSASNSRELISDSTPSSREFATEPTPSTSRELPPVASPDAIRQATPAEPRRRRRQRRSSHVFQSQQATEHDPGMREASKRLEAMEKLNAEATRELAQATHRQAAALEAIAERLQEPIIILLKADEGRSPRRVKRIRIIDSSESE